MPALLFLLKYWKYFAAVGLILCVFGYWFSLTHKITVQEKTIVQLQVDKKLLEANEAICANANKDLATSIMKINAQNEELASLGAKVVARNKELMAALKERDRQIAIKNGQLAAVPWDKLTCPDQVNACYDILRGQP